MYNLKRNSIRNKMLETTLSWLFVQLYLVLYCVVYYCKTIPYIGAYFNRKSNTYHDNVALKNNTLEVSYHTYPVY